MRKRIFGVSDKAYTNRAVKPQKMVRGLNFGFRKKKDCTLYEAKTKLLDTCAFTVKLICVLISANFMQKAGVLMTRLKLR